MDSMRGNNEERLDALFQAYHAACPTPEASANFMPELWRKIESRQRVTFSFGRMANAFVTAALALTIALGVYMSVPHANPYVAQSYIEALAEANPLDTPDIVGPVRLELTDPGK
jgi:Ser/Thr protein kinase RdoA (MazF antagonist)